MIKFGAWSITLLLGSLHGLVMGTLLARARANRIANRCLAALLVSMVLLITPYTIGYAGFYDAYPWLTFAPFFWQLGMGPLVYLYVRQLGEPAMPPRWGRHFLPLAAQVAYYAFLFCQPLETKWRWNDDVHARLVLPLQHLATLASVATYLLLATRHYRRYQRWLADNSAAREEFRLAWLRGFLVASGATLLLAVGFGVTHALFAPLSYFDEFPLYVAFTVLAYFLGIEGWRNANLPYPRMARGAGAADSGEAGLRGDAPAAVGPAEPAEAASPGRDWAALGETFRHRVASAGWWREPDLDLAELSRRLGSNTSYVSRALNDGLGLNFSEFINGQRVAEAQRRLDAPGDILGIALDVGFRSKASFNRAFRAHAGCTPSQWRQRAAEAGITS